jgi:Domain of unknown function (DUF4157)
VSAYDLDHVVTSAAGRRDPDVVVPRPEHGLVSLQRLTGNQAVSRLLRMTETEGAELSSGVEERINAARGGGAPLATDVRAQMERSFATDFGRVRVHTGAEAHALNRDVGGRAFTTGSDVFFAGGEYRPGTSSGRELIAHELAHVVQQDGATVHGKLELGRADDPLEAEADEAARSVIRAEADGSANEDREERAT